LRAHSRSVQKFSLTNHCPAYNMDESPVWGKFQRLGLHNT
jgi:hypothetical protein